MKTLIIIGVALLLLIGGGAAWYLGLIPADAPVEEEAVEEAMILEPVIVDEIDYDAIDASENEPSVAPKIKRVTESFKKKEITAYDFEKPGDRFKARKQVEIEMQEQKETVSRDMRLSSPAYQEKRLRYEAVSRWLGDDGRNLIPTPTPTPEKKK